jgi:hypothetical protein
VYTKSDFQPVEKEKVFSCEIQIFFVLFRIVLVILCWLLSTLEITIKDRDLLQLLFVHDKRRKKQSLQNRDIIHRKKWLI